jgi:hypothetical protein
MNRTVSRVVVLAGVGAGVVALRRMRTTRQLDDVASGDGRDRWHAVTVNRSLQEVAPDGRLPDPIAELGDAVEVQVRPAPADRGTELHARLRAAGSEGDGNAAARIAGEDPVQRLRTALRTSKQLLETGEILSPDKPPSSRRTLRNLPLEMATRRARGEGRL